MAGVDHPDVEAQPGIGARPCLLSRTRFLLGGAAHETACEGLATEGCAGKQKTHCRLRQARGP